MPELPEVELVVRDLKYSVVNRTIKECVISEAVEIGHKLGKQTILKSNIKTFKQRVRGRTILNVGRRGKYMYFLLSDVHTYIVGHLGMSGAFFHVNQLEDIPDLKFKTHWHVMFKLDDGSLLVYSDIRRFGELRIIDHLSMFTPIVNMAPEYTDENSFDYFYNMLMSSKFKDKKIKAAIMNSTVIPGVGNIYACESLFRSGISPMRKSSRVSRSRLKNLHHEIKNVFNESISSGGSTISDYRGVNGQSGGMQNRFKIYQKNTCSCGAKVRTVVIDGRNTFYCTKCQR